MFITTIIAAAGSGKRFGKKKQFSKLLEKPVYLWSVEKFAPLSKEIILVLPCCDIAKIKQQIATKFTLGKPKPAATLPAFKFVAGGKKRFQSIKLALKHISSESDLVCIHDAARPLISSKDIIRCIKLAKKVGAAICATRVTDTVKLSKTLSERTFVDKTLDRKAIWLAQTPQVFKKEIIMNAYKQKIPPDVTDDAQLVENIGYKIQLINTTSNNLKITTQTDFLIAEALLSGIKPESFIESCCSLV